MIEIGGYPVSHDKNGTGGGTTIINGGGNGSVPADLNVTSITAATGTINGLSGISLNYNDAKFMYLAAGDGQINKLRGDEINYALGKIDKLYSSDIESSTIKTEELKATKAWIEELNSKYITTEYLTVTKQAHFFELIIDKVRAVGGTLMMTQAQAVIDYAKAMKKVGSTYVEVPITSNEAQYYDVFFLAKDENNNRTITNDWVPGDQAYCQSFNNVTPNVPNYNVTNKYYWRLVTEKLPDRYMNINTGAELPLSQAAQASVNSVFINTPYVIYTPGGEEDNTYAANTGWHTEAQQISGLPQNPTWTETSGGVGQVTMGTMTTTNTILGIQLTPIEGGGLDQLTPSYFVVSCDNPNTTVVEKARLNIGIYYTDGSSQWFPAPEEPQTTYSYRLTAQTPIESVVITNADEVEWKLVHGIRLSNKYDAGECDAMLSDTSSIPSAGDNLTQLGYRYPYGENDTNEPSRGNAIIIAAYKTPDAGTGISGDRNEYAIVPPSYAQYEFIGSDSAHRFDLAHYRKTYMDSTGSKFIGQFYAQSGNNAPVPLDANYTHIAYMNTPDNSDNSFTTNPQGGTYAYIGIASDNNETAPQNWQAYSWSKMPETKTYRLVDQGSQVYSKMDLNNQNNNQNNIIKSFYFNLRFKVMCVDGTSTRYMTMGEMRDWPKKFTGYSNDNGFYIYARFTKSAMSSSANYYYYKLALNNESGVQDADDAEFTMLFERNSKYTVNWNNEIIIKLIEANIKNDNVQTNCYIADNNEDVLEYTHDTVSMPVSMLSSATMQILDDNITSIVAQGNSISTLQQTSDNISATVYGTQGPQGPQGGLVEQVGQLSIGFNGIQAQVIDISDGIQRTGIDITSGTITLQAGKVEFLGPQGQQSLISIDPNTGTLHATGAVISGTINATGGTITGDMEIKRTDGYTRMVLSPQSINNSYGTSIIGYVENTQVLSLGFMPRNISESTWLPQLQLGTAVNGLAYTTIRDESFLQTTATNDGPYNIYIARQDISLGNNTVYLEGLSISSNIGDNIIIGMTKINNAEKIIFKAVDQGGTSMFPDISYQTSTSNYETGLVYRMSLGSLKAIFDGNYSSWLSDASVLIVKH